MSYSSRKLSPIDPACLIQSAWVRGEQLVCLFGRTNSDTMVAETLMPRSFLRVESIVTWIAMAGLCASREKVDRLALVCLRKHAMVKQVGKQGKRTCLPYTQ